MASKITDELIPLVPADGEVQLSAYTYPGSPSDTTVYGSNFTTAWRYATGQGVTVALIDEGFTPSVINNFDLADSATFSTTFTGIDEQDGGVHGTKTSGMIGASGANGGPVGLAVNASIVGLRPDFGPDGTNDEFAQALAKGGAVASVISNSWDAGGYGNDGTADPTMASFYAAIANDVAHDRSGLGTVIVFAAGNDRGGNDDVAVQPIQDNPEVITVAGSTLAGTVASFSTGGAGLLVSALAQNVDVVLPDGTATTSSGTSFAAPTVASVVALMLQVNPTLGWRDVQEILADSAYQPAPSASGFTTNGAGGWNGGGMLFSNDLGFGIVDANVAVNLARAWNEQSDSANLLQVTQAASQGFSLPVNGSVTATLNEHQSIRVQHVQLTLTDSAVLSADTKLVLTSPDGTQSVLIDDAGLVNGLDQTDGLDLSGFALESNAFWGENAKGTWTLQAVDANGAATGIVSGWSLTFWGDSAASSAAPLVFTPEFATLAASDPSRRFIAPTDAATKTIDLIALPGNSIVNLNGGPGEIDGVTVLLAPGLRNLNADGSAGSLTVVTARAGSQITTGEGSSLIYGAGGNDTVIAGGGGAISIWSGSDASMTFIGGTGKSTFYAGTGNNTLTEGSGADLLVVANWGSRGLETLENFNGALDKVELIGYTRWAEDIALAQQRSDGHGGTLLRLNDTSLDFVGLAHVTQSVFA